MTLSDLLALAPQIENRLRHNFPSHSVRVSVDFPESPNPVCFFEVEGRFFIQGSFWLNEEFRIVAMDAQKGEAFIDHSGQYQTISNAINMVDSLCISAKSAM